MHQRSSFLAFNIHAPSFNKFVQLGFSQFAHRKIQPLSLGKGCQSGTDILLIMHKAPAKGSLVVTLCIGYSSFSKTIRKVLHSHTLNSFLHIYSHIYKSPKGRQFAKTIWQEDILPCFLNSFAKLVQANRRFIQPNIVKGWSKFQIIIVGPISQENTFYDF